MEKGDKVGVLSSKDSQTVNRFILVVNVGKQQECNNSLYYIASDCVLAGKHSITFLHLFGSS